MDNWSFTMDADQHVTIMRGRGIVWEGSYEAFIADGDIRPPEHIVNRIHRRAESLSTIPSDLERRD